MSSFYYENRCASELVQAGSTYRQLRTGLEHIQFGVNQAWKADEMIYINDCFEDIIRLMRQLESELPSIGNDIHGAISDILAERARRARASSKK